MTDSPTAPALQVSQLNTRIRTPRGEIRAIQDVSFDLHAGEILGLVGESGSGKSVTLRSLLKLMPGSAQTSGSVRWQGEELTTLGTRAMSRVRGGQIAMIFQEPMIALNPVLSVHRQIDESLCAHTRLNRKQRKARTLELLNLVGIPDAQNRLEDYPHQFSGGMRQRVMIAVALAGEPSLLLADEPTTALDVTIQEQIIKLLLNLRDHLGMAMIFVTHDLSVVAQLCDQVAVMYAGRIVESGPVVDLFKQPRHPYTQGLMASVPQTGGERQPLRSIDGTPPSLLALPNGCSFSPRCDYRSERCEREVPTLQSLTPQHRVACHHWEALIPLRALGSAS
ncbi:methionine ABC transporter ATP-binding protein [Pseudomonas fluorescens]|uniref:ABC-type dipeptide transporter n=1 Tax=Pseudomonas fluorescens TaxID=294 RepID=A0A1T2Z5X0_PSEFL|nr:ABC transporter ATP-binding protein [Pseudomonas fluorescens]OPA99805.1 methionine ABC transporter ATP-binding protein [Pseudomonas fluorescens]